MDQKPVRAQKDEFSKNLKTIFSKNCQKPMAIQSFSRANLMISALLGVLNQANNVKRQGLQTQNLLVPQQK